MRGKSLALLVLALGCGLVASLGITQVMAKRNGDATAADTQTVLVAVKDVALGDLITAQVVKLEPWPKDRVPPGALTRVEDVEGRRARAKFYAGEPVLEQKLLSKDASTGGYDNLIPKGYRVVSVRVDSVSAQGGLLLPGSRVDLLVHVTRNPAHGFPETTTKTILEDIKVFAVNDVVSLESNGPETKSIQARTVSLLATPAQAEKITLASELGTIRLILRPPEDDVKTHTRGATSQELFGNQDGSNRAKESLMAQERPPSTQKTSNFVAFLEAMRTKAAQEPRAALAMAGASLPERPKWEFRLLKGSEVVDLELEGSDAPKSGSFSLWKVMGSAAASAAHTEPLEVTRLGLSDPQPPQAETKPAKAEPADGKHEAKSGKDGSAPDKSHSSGGKGHPKSAKDDSRSTQGKSTPDGDEGQAGENSRKN